MLTNTTELKGVALDYALARAKHLVPVIERDKWFPYHLELRNCRSEDGQLTMCGRWSHTHEAHRLMNEAGLTVIAPDFEVGHWTSLKHKDGKLVECAGDYSEEAIARCYVRLMVGDTVDIPDEVWEDSQSD